MSIQLGGLATGMNTNQMIDQLVSLERRPIRNLQTDRSRVSADKSQIGKISSALSNLESSLSELETADDFIAHSATSSNEDAFTVSASSGAVATNLDVEVSALARAAKQRSGGFATDHTFGAGTMTIDVWGEDSVDIDIPDGASLDEVRDLIQDSGAKLSATVVYDGTSEYLSLTSKKTGHEIGGNAADALSVSSSSGEFGFTQTQAASNAQMSIDGLAIERSSNTVSDAVDGLTFELVGTTSESEAVEVKPDREVIMEKTQGFVDAYNSALDAIREQSDEGATRRAEFDFGQAVSQATGNGEFPNLASLGITTGASGKLELDTDVLGDSLAEAVDAVADVFADANGVVARLQGQINHYTNNGGVLDSMEDAFDSRIDRIDNSIDRKTRALDRYEERLVRQFSALEQLTAQMNDAWGQLASFLPAGQE